MSIEAGNSNITKTELTPFVIIVMVLVPISLIMTMNQVASASSYVPPSDNFEGIKVNGLYRLFIDNTSNKLYVTSTLPYLFVIDLKKDTIINTISFNRPIYAIGIDPTTSRMYVSSSGSNKIYVYNTVTYKLISTLTAGNDSTGIAADPNHGSIYITSRVSNKINIIRIGTSNNLVFLNESIPEIFNSSQVWPMDVYVNPKTGDAYILNSISVWRLNYATNRISSFANGTGLTALAVNPLTNFIYITNLNRTISVINGSTDKIIVPHGIKVGPIPASIAVNPYENKVYVANLGNSSISVINGNTNHVNTSRIGGSPISITINTNSTGYKNLLYVADRATGMVRMIDGTTGKTVYGIWFKVKPPYSGFIWCNVNNFARINNAFYYRSNNGTTFHCEAQRIDGKAFDHWEGKLPVNETLNPISSFLFLLGNSTNKPETNFVLSDHGTNVTAAFTNSSFFSDKYGNFISIAAVMACIIIAAVYSKRTKVKEREDKDTELLTIDATIIAGVLILLSVQSVAFKTTQIAIITADIVFPFALSIIAGLARKPVYAKTFAIAGCVNFILSIILLIIISFRSHV